LIDESDLDADSSDAALTYLAVAHGLSLERQKWPKWEMPGVIEISVADIKVDDPYELRHGEYS
jgi:hypothetical protein